MKNPQPILRKLTRFFGSQTFFYIVIAFFVFEALWFVFSAIYPMAFDEDVHLGIIRIYGEQWSPFLTEHPAGAEKFGAVTRDPSFLFHYLMSFPYRLLTLFTNSETVQVIWLRLFNVALFTGSFWLYKKVMLRARASRALTHVSLAVFALIPIAPHLAAHINYDNLFMVLLPLLALSAFDLIDGFKKKQIDMRAFLLFVCWCFTISLVKYAALPLILGAVVFLLIVGIKNFRGEYGRIWFTAKKSLAHMPRPLLVTLLSVIAALAIMFGQRYGYNLVTYKTPVPACDQVLTIEQCSQYGPWNRDYNFMKTRDAGFDLNPVEYLGVWLYGMWRRLFFAINGARSYFNNYAGLLVPSTTAVVLAVAGFGLVVFWRSRIFAGNQALAFLATISIFYIAVLWLENFEAFTRTGRAVAVNGRYFLPILLFLAVIIGRGFSLTLRKHQQLKGMFAALVILLFLHGGGISTFILRSDESWYWPNAAVIKVNDTARAILAPITIEAEHWTSANH